MAKHPLDPFPYEQHKDSVALHLGLADGCYVYVQDVNDIIHVLPDGPHRHTRVLGNASAANYAGDFEITKGCILDLTNLSGTFQFDDRQGLLKIAAKMESLGFAIQPSAVRFFPVDGSRPVVLR
jgi:hypothetical protein